MQSTPFVALAAALLPLSLAAQTTTYIAPKGLQTVEGNANNTIPFWAGSGSYQQIHDQSDLVNVFPNPGALIKGMSFRKDGPSTATTVARTLDLQITLGMTSVSAGTATTTFATNLGASPTVVLPYTNVSIPALSPSTTPAPIGFTFPFTTPFPYVGTPGNNLCWEFRFKNSTSTASMAMDAASATVTSLAFLGTGCVATGQTTAAAIGLRSLSLTTGVWRNRMDRAAANAPAVFFFGIQPQQIGLPGLCSRLEILPLIDINGVASATGQWDLSLTLGSLAGVPQVDIYGQFVFLDQGLPLGLGFTPAGGYRLPAPNLYSLTRMWFGGSGSGQGNETATTGTLGLYYGLVTGFEL